MLMQLCALYNLVKYLKNSPLLKISACSIVLIYSSLCFAKMPAPTYTAPLITPVITQLTDHLVRVTLTLNPRLNPTKSYNIGVFVLGDLITNCETYAHFNACYFQNITTSSTMSFLLIGDFTNGLLDDKHAILVVFSLPAPDEVRHSDTVHFEGIHYPKTNAATIEYYPFKRIVSS